MPALVWAMALLNTVAYGALYYAQPLLAVQFERDLGWPRTTTALAFTLALLVTALTAPAVGRALDRQGGHFLLTAGSLLGAAALTLMTLTTHPLPFTLAWLLAGLAMSLTFYEATFTVLGQQIQGVARTRATLTITLVAGLANTIFVPLTTLLLHHAGRQATLLVLAALLVICALFVQFCIPARKRGTDRPHPLPFQPERTFWHLTAAFTLGRIVTVGVGLQLAPLLLWKGLSPAFAAALTGLMGLSALPGRVVFVPLLRHFGVQRVTLGLFVMMGLGAALLTASHLSWWAGGVTLFGLASGALTLARAELLARHYPPELFGTVNGKLAWFVNLAQALTPLWVGWLFTVTGRYVPSLAMCVLFACAAGLALFRVRQFKEKAI